MAFDLNTFGKMTGLGGIGSGLLGLFGGHDNPADEANKYFRQIPGAVKGYYQPYMEAGNRAIPQLEEQYGQLLNQPGQKLNTIGKDFHASPGFQFALQQALQGAGHAAAAGGMAGSPQHEQWNQGLATDLGNQDYYNWLGKATGLYGQGLQGEQGMYAGGLQASHSMADQVAQALAAQGAYGYEGAAGKNKAFGSDIGNLFGGAATLAAFI